VLLEEFGLVEIKPRRLLAASSGPGAALDAIERRRA
jgi:hypothetical protein